MRKREMAILFFLLVFLFVIRLYHINTPPLEMADSWRQADTESMARNFLQYDPHLFHPNLNYDGPFPNIPALEIQITPYLIAILYRIFGQHYFLARLVPIIFFLVSAAFLYLFARLHMDKRGAAFSALIYGILPVNVYYSRAVMPESAALMFWIGGIYLFDLGLRQSKKKVLALSAILMALAIMTKPPVIFAALPMMYLCFHYDGRQWLKNGILWLYAFVTLGIAAGYYYHSAGVADYLFTVGISRDLVFKHALTAFYSTEALKFFAGTLPVTLGFTGIILTLAGLFTLSSNQKIFMVWFLAMVLEVVLIVSPIRLSYYLIFLTVPCSLLIGNFIAQISSANPKTSTTFLKSLSNSLTHFLHPKSVWVPHVPASSEARKAKRGCCDGHCTSTSFLNSLYTSNQVCVPQFRRQAEHGLRSAALCAKDGARAESGMWHADQPRLLHPSVMVFRERCTRHSPGVGRGKAKGSMLIACTLLFILMAESYHAVKPMYTVNTAMAEQVAVVRQITQPNDLLVVGSIDPCLLSLADRRGWRYHIRIYSEVPQDPINELNYYIQRGAKYFVPVLGKIYGDENNQLLTFIQKKYPKIENVPGYPMYILQ